MGEPNAQASTAGKVEVLDHEYFSSTSTCALSPHLALWQAVRSKHADHQMLAVKGCSPLIEFIRSEHDATEEQLLGHDLVPFQHSSVQVKPAASTQLGNARSMMGNGRCGWMESEKGIRSDDISSRLENGIFSFLYQECLFYVYVFHFLFGHGETEMTILVWKSDAEDGLDPLRGKRLLANAYTWASTLREQMWVFHGALGGWRRDSSFYHAVSTAKEEDMVLPADLVEQLYRDTQGFFSNETLYRQLSVTWKRGILLLGPPGNGKTNMIRILLQKCKGIPALYVQSAKTQYGAESGMQAIFAKARQCAPCILILEDIETLVSGDARSFMLNQLDGIEPNDGILVIATANDISKLDAAILQRPSRFDVKYMFDLPNEDLRKRFVATWIDHKIGRDKLVYDSEKVSDRDALIDLVVLSTEGWSFAFLKELFLSYLLGIASAAVKVAPQDPVASVQNLLENIELLSKQLALGTTVEEAAKKERSANATTAASRTGEFQGPHFFNLTPGHQMTSTWR